MKKLILILTTLMLVACFKPKGYDEAASAFQHKNWDNAAAKFARLVIAYPDNVEFKVKWEMAKNNAAKFHARIGRKAMMKGNLDQAVKELNKSLFYDATNHFVQDQLDRVMDKIVQREKEKGEAGTTLEQMQEKTEGKTGVPMLSPASGRPIDLYFPAKKSLRDIYHALGVSSGINILFDTSFQDTQISIDLRGMTFYNALKSLMLATGHFYKVIDNKTIIILRDTKQNHDKYDDKIIKVFYLSYAKPIDMKNNLRLLTGIKEIFDNKDLNCVVVMGTPQQIAIANRIVSLNDKPKAEVMVDFELMEVNRSNLDQLGISPTDGSNPTYKVGAGLFSGSADSTSTAPGFVDRNNAVWRFGIPLLQLDFLKSIGEAKDVSNPTIRVSEGEKGKILIGQSVPIATTSFTPFTGATGTNTSAYSGIGGQPLTSFNYQEVGIKIEVTPRVHHNGDISLKLKLEVSSIVDNKAGFQPVIGKRTVETVLRVKNGESVMMAGLLKDTERSSLNGIKGLADIPLLGRLFSSTKKELEQTDVMMTITPHIVRGPNIKEADMMPYAVGSKVESNFSPDDPFGTGRRNESVKGKNKRLPSVKKSNPSGSGQEKKMMSPTGGTSENAGEKSDSRLSTGEGAGSKSFSSASMIPAMISLTPRRMKVQVGKTSMQSLFATNFRDVDMVDLVLTFDPTKIKVVDVVQGGFMAGDGTGVSFIPVWDNKNGRLALTIDRKGGATGRSGTGMLANIVIKGIGRGASPVGSINSSKVVAADGSPVGFKFINGEVLVH